MAFNIDQFSAKINQHGLQKGNRFRFRMMPPKGISNEVSALYGDLTMQGLEFYCRSVTLPEFDVTTADIQHQGIGAISRRPQTMNFPVLPVVFNVDADMKMVKYFHRWSQQIINYDRTKSSYGNVNGQLPFEIGYKQDYATTMLCDVFADDGTIAYTYEFGEAYPINIGNVEVAWANNDEIQTLAVGFSYDMLKVSGAKSPNPARLGDRIESQDPLGREGKVIKEVTDTTESLAESGIVGRLARKIFAPGWPF